MEKLFDMIDYKGKYFIIQDKESFNEDWDFINWAITKEEATKKDFVKEHKENCEYYGIPAYIGSDKDLLKAYK